MPAPSRIRSRTPKPHVTSVRRQLEPPPHSRGGWRAMLIGGLAVALVTAGVLTYQARLAGSEPLVPLTRGTVEHTLDLDTYVVRAERVYTAPAAGRVQRLVEEGRRVRVGTPVVAILPGSSAPPASAPTTQPSSDAGQSAVRREMDELAGRIFRTAVAANQARDKGDTATFDRLQTEMDQMSLRQWELARSLGRAEEAPVGAAAPPPLTAGATEVVSQVAGVLVYRMDGLETALNPAQLTEWKPSWFRSLLVAPAHTADSVTAGQPVFKVVDNLSLGLVTVMPASAATVLAGESRVQLRFPGRDVAPVTARIASRREENGEVLLYLTAPRFPEELTELRRVRVTAMLGRYEGLVAPRTAIDVREGVQGVWYHDGRKAVFHPAKVMGGNEAQVALETDLLPGTRILRDAPTWMR